jgi:bifunctional enzyme CysN/CysC
MAEKSLEERARLLIKQTTRTVPARTEEIVSVVDISTLEDRRAPGRMELNDLGVVRFRRAEPLVVDPYKEHRWTGSFILIDESSNDTVGAGMVVEAS